MTGDQTDDQDDSGPPLAPPAPPAEDYGDADDFRDAGEAAPEPARPRAAPPEEYAPTTPPPTPPRLVAPASDTGRRDAAPSPLVGAIVPEAPPPGAHPAPPPPRPAIRMADIPLVGWLARRFQPPPVVEPEPFPPVEKAVILGPSKAGKTAKLMACSRACTLGAVGPYELRFTCNSEATALLVQQGVQGLRGKGEAHKATDNELHRYEFGVGGELRLPGGPARPFSMNVTLSDTAGGACFPERGATPDADARDQILAEGAKSEVLVFCFDATRRWGVLVSEQLSEVLFRMSPDRRLKASRILVLLNKVDQVAARLAVGMRDSDSVHPAVTEYDLAQLLDPVGLANASLGVGQLAIFRQYAPTATLAVGLCSASGFTSHGHPVLDARGVPIRPDGGPETDDNVFWDEHRPYGIVEALLFMATGHATGPVHILTRSELEVRPGPTPRVRVRA